MKRIVVVLIISVFAVSGISAQESLSNVVRNFQDNNSEFTLVIPSFLIKLGVTYGDMEEEEREVLEQIHNMKIVISESKFDRKDFTMLDEGIKSGNFQEVMTVYEGQDKVRMIMNKKSKRRSEMLMLVESDDENVLMLFDFHGEPDFSKLMTLAD